jgi:hypothetical protein
MGNGVGMESMANLDPATYMSPLDLYESIWWGKYLDIKDAS